MFIDELFSSAKPVPTLLSMRNSQYKARDKVYVTLNKSSEAVLAALRKQTKAAPDQLQYTRSKAALREIRSRPES